MLTVARARAKQEQYTIHTHVGYETAAWYWHFVDVVWLYLFLAIYFWGSLL
jgi:cytochrome c oxidase subunit 3